MKKTNLLIAIAVIFMASAITIVSCKKEQVPDTPNQEKSTLARILDFKRQLEEVELNPNERTVTYMSIADAVWNIEALFNYTYAYPDESYGQTICCDTTLSLPVCSNDSVSLADLFVFNGLMYEAVLALYQAAILDNKQFIILDVEAGERIGSQQYIKLHTAQGSVKGGTIPTPPSPPQNGPFAPGISWYYGEDGGNSQGFGFHIMDAADTLSSMLNYYLVPIAPENHEYIYTQIKIKYTEPGSCHYTNPWTGFPNVFPRYCEFYIENPSNDDYWLSSEQMNFYYFGEQHLVLNVFPSDANDPIPQGHSLFFVIVEDYTPTYGTTSTLEHHTTAYYGNRITTALDSIHPGVL